MASTRPVTPQPAMAQAVHALSRAPEFRTLYQILRAEASTSPAAAAEAVDFLAARVKERLLEFVDSVQKT